LLDRQERIRCVMGYVVNLTLILQAILQVFLENRLQGKVTGDNVDEIIHEFQCSEKKNRIHNAIWTFTGSQHSLVRDNVADKIESLIRENEVRSYSRQQRFANCRLTHCDIGDAG